VTLSAGCAVFPLLMNGCATTSGIEATGTVLVDNNPSGLYTSIVINNSGLARDLEIAGMKSENPGNLMVVQVAVRSKSRDTVPIQYKFSWFDARGFEINANQAWSPLIVYSKEMVTIRGVAPDPLVKEFKLNIRAQDASE
jgi:uncharacterized protein YcfL